MSAGLGVYNIRKKLCGGYMGTNEVFGRAFSVGVCNRILGMVLSLTLMCDSVTLQSLHFFRSLVAYMIFR